MYTIGFIIYNFYMYFCILPLSCIVRGQGIRNIELRRHSINQYRWNQIYQTCETSRQSSCTSTWFHLFQLTISHLTSGSKHKGLLQAKAGSKYHGLHRIAESHCAYPSRPQPCLPENEDSPRAGNCWARLRHPCHPNLILRKYWIFSGFWIDRQAGYRRCPSGMGVSRFLVYNRTWVLIFPPAAGWLAVGPASEESY